MMILSVCIDAVEAALTDGIFPDFGLSAEERRFAVRGHYYEHPGMDGDRGEIWGYTRAYAYRSGATVELHISSTGASCRLEGVRDGATETVVLVRDGIATRWQETPDQCSVTGCGWEPTTAFDIDPSWPSGAYRITLTAEGRDGNPVHYDHLIIVLPAPGSKKGRILQVAATGTWSAYNT